MVRGYQPEYFVLWVWCVCSAKRVELYKLDFSFGHENIKSQGGEGVPGLAVLLPCKRKALRSSIKYFKWRAPAASSLHKPCCLHGQVVTTLVSLSSLAFSLLLRKKKRE
ncbi:hypothetical protein CEXT_132381 [Caerostris extrusa]|uniref:Uncharacterized protein n=1 Tax=Caerostris extrusa TaxID=172846 RepID=A0AAV4UAE3_CAEEX|nr:hypothetical protein CEXT_132381 [Caerostris extrusa]